MQAVAKYSIRRIPQSDRPLFNVYTYKMRTRTKTQLQFFRNSLNLTIEKRNSAGQHNTTL